MPPSNNDVAPVLFVDRALGAEDVANALRVAGAIVKVHRDHFPAAELSDAPWIKAVSERGWVILTKDKRIKRNALERKTLEDAGAATFILNAGDLNSETMSAAFVAALPRIRKLLVTHTRPLLCTVAKDGRVTVLVGQRRGGVKKDTNR